MVCMATSDPAAVGDEEPAFWVLWRGLKRHFPVWSLLPSSFNTPGAWGYFGNDFVSGFGRNPSTRRALALLGDVDGKTFDAVAGLAALNVKRHEQMTRAVIIGYLTVPVSVTALVAEVAGDSVSSLMRDHLALGVQIAVILAIGPLGYLMGLWRARQMVGVLDLVRIERAFRRP